MSAPGRTLKPKSSRLLTLFSISAIAFLTVTLALTYAGIQFIYHQYVIEAAKRQSVSVGRALYLNERSLLTSGEPPSSLAVPEEGFGRLDRRMREYLPSFHITKITIYNAESEVIYSTDASEVGKVERRNARLGRALEGAVVAELESEEKVIGVGGEIRRNVEVVETYIPVNGGQETVIGAFELHLDMTPHAQLEGEAIRFSISALAAVLLVSYFVQFLILRRGTVQLGEYENKLRSMAVTDELTGLANRRFVLDRAREEFDRVKRLPESAQGNDSVGCIMVDVDWFKHINDTFGHGGGDTILSDLAMRLRPLVRPYDIIGRYGGEEFIVLVPHAGPEQTHAIAERIWREIREQPFLYQGQELYVTASIGFSCIQQDDDSIEQTINRADDNLYAAKRQGRDRIIP